MIETDAFWGIAAGGGAVGVAPGPATAEATALVISRGPDEVRELTLGMPVLVPGLRPLTGEALVEGLDASGVAHPLVSRGGNGCVVLAFDPDPAVRDLTGREALTRGKPLSARLPLPYRRVPGRVRQVLRDSMVSRSRQQGGFPRWPVEPSVEVLRRLHLHARRLAGGDEPRPLWPDGRRYALVLTHDVDSRGGLRLAPEIAKEETDRGLRSCWYVVGGDWPVDYDTLRQLAGDGHEVGLHDTHHDNRGPFLTAGALGARLDRCADLVGAFGMEGYRSPSMLRSAAMYDALRPRFAYDSSVPDAGLLPAANGCATVFPLRIGDVPVLPLTVAPDGQLRGLGLGPDEIVDRWIDKIGWVARAGGIAMVLTHPEPGFSADAAMRAAYRRFLDWVAAQDDAWHTLPREVARWWPTRNLPA